MWVPAHHRRTQARCEKRARRRRCPVCHEEGDVALRLLALAGGGLAVWLAWRHGYGQGEQSGATYHTIAAEVEAAGTNR